MFQSVIKKLKPYLTRKSLALFGTLAIMVVLPLAVNAGPPDKTDAALAGAPTDVAAANAVAAKAAAANPTPPKEGCSTIVDCITYGVELGVVMIAKLIMRLMGFILILLVRALIWAAQYSNFVSPGPTAVRIGWIVTRDLANMFFIVVLLISAFSTIIGYKDYHYTTVMPRLLITAVLINFSKTLVGILIDFSQVIMLTFVNGFAQAAGGNFMNAFQINKLMDLVNEREINFIGLILGLLLALVMVTVATAVVLVLTVYLVARIVKIWILIIMAPIAFISKVIPGISGDYAKWWGELTKLLIAGPKIAFFLWLALITAQNSGGNVAQGDGFVPPGSETGASSQEVASAQAATPGIPTAAGQSDTILSMVIMITLLLAGLQQAQEGGVPGADFAKKVQGGLKSMGAFAKRQTVDRAVNTAKTGGRAVLGGGIALAGRGAGFVSGKVSGGIAKVPFARALVPKTRARDLRTQAAKLRATRKPEDAVAAAKLENSAKRWDTYGRVKDFIAPNVIGGTARAIQSGGQSMLAANDAATAKKTEEAGKRLTQGKTEKDAMQSALDIVNGTKTASSQHELFAAFKMAVNSGKADASVIAGGRLAMQGASTGDRDAFEKSAREKYGLYFDKDSNVDNKQLNDAIDKKKVNFGGLNESAQRQVLETAMQGRTEEAIGKMMRDNHVPNEAITKDMVAQHSSVASHLLEKTKRNSEAREELMTGALGQSLRDAVGTMYAKAQTDPDATASQIAEALKEAILAGSATAADISSAPDNVKKAIGDHLDIGGLAKLMDSVPTEQRGKVQQAAQAAVTIYIAAKPGRAKKVSQNESYEEAHILPPDLEVPPDEGPAPTPRPTPTPAPAPPSRPSAPTSAPSNAYTEAAERAEAEARARAAAPRPAPTTPPPTTPPAGGTTA